MEQAGKTAEKLVSQMQENQEKQTGLSDLCEIHGIAKEQIPSPPYDIRCLECEKDKSIKEAQKRNLDKRISNISLSKRTSTYLFENFKRETSGQEKAYSACKKLTDSFKTDIVHGGLVMIGGVGTGKTHLSVSMCKDVVVKSGLNAKLSTTTEIIREIRATWKGDLKDEWYKSVSEESLIEKYSNIDLLVIDEVGSQYGSDSEKIIISEIINKRYENNLPSVVCGNITMKQMKTYLGERAIDRILHNGEIVVFDWDSERTK